jgi:hypothetical protein
MKIEKYMKTKKFINGEEVFGNSDVFEERNL